MSYIVSRNIYIYIDIYIVQRNRNKEIYNIDI